VSAALTGAARVRVRALLCALALAASSLAGCGSSVYLVLISVLKSWYDRDRPPGSLIATSASSFPSGHASARLAGGPLTADPAGPAHAGR
jgi:membrane-associated phospholipid phosphatase